MLTEVLTLTPKSEQDCMIRLLGLRLDMTMSAADR
jgi:hypothetical protein